MKLPLTLALLFLLSFAAVLAEENATINETSTPNQTVVEPIGLICSKEQCDSDCVECSDHACHEPGFECEEKLTVSSIFPKEIMQGQTQINILLRNTGNVDLKDIFAEITGDGITTLERIAINKLTAGDKDYAFVKIDAEKSGMIDIIVKIYVDEVIGYKFVDQIFVAEIPAAKELAEEFNTTELSNSLTEIKNKFKVLEAEYQEKKTQGYIVDILYDKLREVSGYITDTQAAMFQGEYKKVQANIGLLNDALADLQDQMMIAQKPKQSIGSVLKNNVFFIGSLAATIVSIFTAYTIIHGRVHKHLKHLKNKAKKNKRRNNKETRQNKEVKETKTE